MQKRTENGSLSDEDDFSEVDEGRKQSWHVELDGSDGEQNKVISLHKVGSSNNKLLPRRLRKSE